MDCKPKPPALGVHPQELGDAWDGFALDSERTTPSQPTSKPLHGTSSRRRISGDPLLGQQALFWHMAKSHYACNPVSPNFSKPLDTLRASIADCTSPRDQCRTNASKQAARPQTDTSNATQGPDLPASATTASVFEATLGVLSCVDALGMTEHPGQVDAIFNAKPEERAVKSRPAQTTTLPLQNPHANHPKVMHGMGSGALPPRKVCKGVNGTPQFAKVPWTVLDRAEIARKKAAARWVRPASETAPSPAAPTPPTTQGPAPPDTAAKPSAPSKLSVAATSFEPTPSVPAPPASTETPEEKKALEMAVERMAALEREMAALKTALLANVTASIDTKATSDAAPGSNPSRATPKVGIKAEDPAAPLARPSAPLTTIAEEDRALTGKPDPALVEPVAVYKPPKRTAALAPPGPDPRTKTTWQAPRRDPVQAVDPLRGSGTLGPGSAGGREQWANGAADTSRPPAYAPKVSQADRATSWFAASPTDAKAVRRSNAYESCTGGATTAAGVAEVIGGTGTPSQATAPPSGVTAARGPEGAGGSTASHTTRQHRSFATAPTPAMTTQAAAVPQAPVRGYAPSPVPPAAAVPPTGTQHPSVPCVTAEELMTLHIILSKAGIALPGFPVAPVPSGGTAAPPPASVSLAKPPVHACVPASGSVAAGGSQGNGSVGSSVLQAILAKAGIPIPGATKPPAAYAAVHPPQSSNRQPPPPPAAPQAPKQAGQATTTRPPQQESTANRVDAPPSARAPPPPCPGNRAALMTTAQSAAARALEQPAARRVARAAANKRTAPAIKERTAVPAQPAPSRADVIASLDHVQLRAWASRRAEESSSRLVEVKLTMLLKERGLPREDAEAGLVAELRRVAEEHAAGLRGSLEEEFYERRVEEAVAGMLG